MLGKASEIKTVLLFEMIGNTIDSEINGYLEERPNIIVLDIKFAIVQNGDNSNEANREALIIYREEKNENS